MVLVSRKFFLTKLIGVEMDPKSELGSLMIIIELFVRISAHLEYRKTSSRTRRHAIPRSSSHSFLSSLSAAPIKLWASLQRRLLLTLRGWRYLERKSNGSIAVIVLTVRPRIENHSLSLVRCSRYSFKGKKKKTPLFQRMVITENIDPNTLCT